MHTNQRQIRKLEVVYKFEKKKMDQLIERIEQLSLIARSDEELDQKELELVDYLREQKEEHRRSVIGLSGDEYESEVLKRGRDITSEGYSLFSKIQKTLSSFVINPALRTRRSPMQMEFHSKVLNGLLPHIYGKEWALNEDAVLAKHSLAVKPKRHLLLSCPRRFGKTTALGMISAALLYCIEKPFRIVACSQNKPTSMILIRVALMLLSQLPDTKGRVFFHVADNRPTITYSKRGLRDDPLGTVLMGVPSGGTNNRGGDADFVIFDEMAFMKSETIAVISALLRKEGSVMVGLSSLQQDDNNFFNQLLEEKDKKGDLLFEVSRAEMMCHECRQNRMAMTCPHMREEDPHFLTLDSSEVIAALMKSDPALYQAEILGISQQLAARALNDELLKKMYNDPPMLAPEDAPLVHVFVDPSGGGSSKSAIVSFIIFSNFSIGVTTLSLLFICLFPFLFSLCVSLCCSYFLRCYSSSRSSRDLRGGGRNERGSGKYGGGLSISCRRFIPKGSMRQTWKQIAPAARSAIVVPFPLM